MDYPTIKQAAQELEISEWTLRQMVKEKKVPGFYRGNRFYVNLEMLKEQFNRMSMEIVEDR